MRENLTLLHGNNKGVDHTAHSRSLDSAFVIRFLKNIIYVGKLAACNISIFRLVLVAEQAGLSLTWSETPNAGSLAPRTEKGQPKIE